MTHSLSLAMRRYSVKLRDQILVKDYGFLSFVGTIGKNVGKSSSQNISINQSQKLLDHTK